MPSFRTPKYGNTAVDVASIQEFVQGYQAKNAAANRDALKALAVGALTAAAVSFYRDRRR